ncbi:M10 family metallopeptidase domain-containing protein [Actinokineospora sp. PR83]|uniref:M10 family metallopeptidase domain-containing protein n=1 Tax=Actinokineospora sp. PR83 TaxID=2884908 RepID=UPI0021078683|nr:M10 family metallopeptidase domain-containing protein [Actinokineospora sp. PR83]
MRTSSRATTAALTLAVVAAATLNTPQGTSGGATAPGNPTRDAITADGTRVIASAIRAGGPAAAPRSTTDTACTDHSYALNRWRVSGTLTWYYNGRAAAPAVADTALPALTSASDTVATGVNRCGKPATFTTVYAYGGEVGATAQISADGRCTGNDGKSVTSWGALPPGVLAYTCTFATEQGLVLTSDTLLDNRAHTWFTTRPENCANAYDLETTLTHERLHTAGLAHVNQAASPDQVMTPASPPCETSRRTLGAGDYAGLAALAAQN